MLHWQQLLLVVAQGHLSSSSFPSWQCFSQITVRNLWRRTSATTVRSQQRTMKQRIMWKPLQCLQELVAHENNCTVCSITTNMISLLSLLPLHTTLHCTVCKRVSCFSKAMFLLDPWLAIQHPTKRNFAILLLDELLDKGCFIPIFRQVGPVRLYSFLSTTNPTLPNMCPKNSSGERSGLVEVWHLGNGNGHWSRSLRLPLVQRKQIRKFRQRNANITCFKT